MANFPTPNVSGEQATKLTIRANNFGGGNSYWSNPNPNPTLLVNAADAANVNAGLYRLVFSGASAATTFVVSGSQFVASGLSGNTTVSGFAAIVGAAIPSTYSLVTWNKASDTLSQLGTTDFVLVAPTGTTLSALTITSGSSNVLPAQVNQVTATASTLSGVYPNYFNTPYSTPNWTDDAVVHAYPIYGFGNTTQDTSKTVEVQVRQIQTNVSETQIYTGYFAAYQANLNQSKQKNTRQQQC